MGLIDAGVPARDYTNNRKKIMCKLYEGDLKYNPNGFGYDGRKKVQHSLTAPITETTLVELHEDSTPRHIIVKPAEDGSEKIIGRVLFSPRLGWTPEWTTEQKNRLPMEDRVWGEYVPRQATVEFFGKAIDYIDLVAENEAIAVNDNLEFVSGTTFKKSKGTTSLLALAKVDALKSGKIPVLEGYEFYGVPQE